MTEQKDQTLQVVEQFTSINGEGRRAGQLAVFVRFKGCNLDCEYCDTKWANEADAPFEARKITEIVTSVTDTGVKNVTLTGGEPLLQKHIKLLIEQLLQAGLRVEIETNGSVAISPFRIAGYDKQLTFTVDYKLGCSKMEEKMLSENFDAVQEQDTVKFVVGSEEDLHRAKEIIDEHHLIGKCSIYFSPVFGAIELEQIVEFMKKEKLNDVNMQIQMHKVIWDPNAKGV